MSPKSRRWYQRGEQFYAVYYTTEFKYIGRGDAFIAPRDGTYTFKLWGSPGGVPKSYKNFKFDMDADKGAYVQVAVSLRKNQKVYAFVGSAGEAADSLAVGGYNGGGWTDPHKGTHSGSGGGATHISWSSNPIISDVIYRIEKKNDTDMKQPDAANPYYYQDRLTTTGSDGKEKDDRTKEHVKDLLVKKGLISSDTKVERIGFDITAGWVEARDHYICYTHKWNNTENVIAIAGGAGSTGLKNPDGNGRSQLHSYGGTESACVALTAYSQASPVAANNTTRTGYAQGTGRFSLGNGGGGGGWYGGNAIDGCCFGSGGGGTSYIRSDYTGLMIAGNDERITNYVKPVTEGRNGYIKVSR